MAMIESEIKNEKLLGKGQYGSVYKIVGKNLAIKYIKSGGDGIKELGELTNLKRFIHPYIISCSGFTINSKMLGIVLPLALGDMTITTEKCKLNITDVVITEWFYQIISAVHFLHKNGFYHCDIKPQNILFIEDKVVLADLGFVAKKGLDTYAVCQSIMSPQLLYKRNKEIGTRHNTDIFKLPSNEYQDDIWALGQTFYYMMISEHKNYLGLNDFTRYDYFINNRKSVLVKSEISERYIPLLLLLLDPLPENRSLNLLSLLNLDLFKDKLTLVDGTMTIVHNPKPVIFGTTEKITKLKFVLNKLLTTFSEGNVVDLKIQACDLLYRTYEFVNPMGNDDITSYINTLILVILKINNISTGKFVTSKMKQLEIKFVKWTGGHLSRTLVSDFISPDKYKTFINWLVENPEKYEQCSISKLTHIINNI